MRDNRPLLRLAVSFVMGVWGASLAGGAYAFEITAEQRQACMGDALRLCGSEIPDVDRVLICMRSKKSQVSAHCRATIPKSVVRSL